MGAGIGGVEEMIYCKNCKYLVLKKGYNYCYSLGDACGWVKGKESQEIYLKMVEPKGNIGDMVGVKKGLLNEKYDCNFYERKWWKVWVK